MNPALAYDPVKGRRGAHHGFNLFGVGVVIASQVGGLTLPPCQFGHDYGLVFSQGIRDRSEVTGQVGVGLLRGQSLCPVEREIEVAVAPSTCGLAESAASE